MLGNKAKGRIADSSAAVAIREHQSQNTVFVLPLEITLEKEPGFSLGC